MNARRYERSADRYTRIPDRIFDAVRLGDVDAAGFIVLAFLIHDADLRRTGEIAFTKRSLIDAIGWPWGDDKLWRTLRALRADGWIDYDSKSGQRSPYRFRLRRAALVVDAGDANRDLRTTSGSKEAGEAEVLTEVTAAGRRSTRVAIPPPDGDFEAPSPPRVGGPREETRGATASGEESDDDFYAVLDDALSTRSAANHAWPDTFGLTTEEAILSDCDLLVSAGEARWLDDLVGGER